MNWEEELKLKWGITPHHEEICNKALEQFESDMKSIRCETGEQGTLNPTIIKALTFYRCYEDIISQIKYLLKQQREICAKTYLGADLTKSTYNQILNAPEPTMEKLK